MVPNKHGLTAFFHLRFKSHGDFPKLSFFKRKLLYLIVFQHVPAESVRSAVPRTNICLHRSIKLHDAGRRF